MKLELDFRSSIPIYLQVVEQVKRLLATGQLQPGDQLPTVRSLATELRVNFNTIARAYRILDESGIISTQQGRGTYILEASAPEADEDLRRQALEELTAHFLEDLARLGVRPEELDQVLPDMLEEWKENDLPEAGAVSDKGDR